MLVLSAGIISSPLFRFTMFVKQIINFIFGHQKLEGFVRRAVGCCTHDYFLEFIHLLLKI